SLEHALTRWSLLFAGLLIVIPTVLVHLDYTYNKSLTVGFAVGFGLACLISLLPFVAIRVAGTLAIRGSATSVGPVYGFDLVGAGIGAAAVVPVMWIVSAPSGMVVLGVVAALAA